jgi:acyl carrier protein
MKTHDWVASVLAEYVPVMPASRPLPEGLSLRQDLALDSLGLVSVLIRLGDDFGIDVDDQEFDLAGLETVGDLVDLVEQLALAPQNDVPSWLDISKDKELVMNEKPSNNRGTDVVIETTTEVNAARETDSDDEFKITVRKLVMPVRPRGVLAE